MSFPSQRINTGAYTTPFSNTGVEFFPLGIMPDHSGVVLHESGYLRRNSNWNFPNMFSPFWRLIYDGKPGHKIVFADKEIALGPDRIVLLPDNRHCHFTEERPTPTLWLHFSHSRCPVPRQVIPIELPPSRTELGLIEDLIQLFTRKRNEELRERIFRLSLALLQIVLSRQEIQWMSEKPLALMHVIRHIEQNYAQPLYNPQLARLANMCTTNFVEAFRQAQGVTPAQFVAQVRVREASNLLANTSMGLGEIADQTGFPNRAYFSRVFKRMTGESPAHFRHQHAVSV